MSLFCRDIREARFGYWSLTQSVERTHLYKTSKEQSGADTFMQNAQLSMTKRGFMKSLVTRIKHHGMTSFIKQFVAF